MMSQQPNSMTRRSGAMLVLLILLGFLGNYYTLPLFFGADFLFGSLAILLVLYFYGLVWGLVAAVIANSYTYVLWGHPYGFIVFILEAIVVGYFLRSERRNLFLLDGLFWLLIGIPLDWVFYHVVMHMDVNTTSFIMLKQGVNGIFNALLASLVINYLPLAKLFRRSQTRRTYSLQETLFNLLVGLVLFPALVLMVMETRDEMRKIEETIVTDLQTVSNAVQYHLHYWYHDRLVAVTELAGLPGKFALMPSPELQKGVELIKRTFPDFHNMYIANAEGTTVAFYPPVNEKGESTIGLNFSDRPYFKELQATKSPVISEVFMGRGGVVSPIVTLSVPIIRENRFMGFALGALNLNRVQELLKPYGKDGGMIITLIDSQGEIIASTSSERTPLQSWDPKRTGVMTPVNFTLFRWSPRDPNLPSMTRWKRSYFIQETAFGENIPWNLVIEAPIAPHQQHLSAMYVQNLSIMAILSALTLLLALALSRWLASPLAKLAKVTTDLPDKIMGRQNIDWPRSSVTEMDSMICNFQSMTRALQRNFIDLEGHSKMLASANQALKVEAKEREQAETRLARLNDCFLSFGNNFDENIQRLVEVGGELLGGTCALYNRVQGDKLFSLGQWQTPPDYQTEDLAEGTICFDVIRQSTDQPLLVRNLQASHYAQSDPNVTRYGFQTYMGAAVHCQQAAVGSICIVYQADIDPNPNDMNLLNIISTAIGVEEERKQSVMALRKSELKYRLLVNNIPAMVFKGYADWSVDFVTNKIEDLTGYTKEEFDFRRLKWSDLIISEDLPGAKEIYRKALEGNKQYIREYRIRNKKGEMLWIQDRGQIFCDRDGRIDYSSGVFFDISERKKIEEERLTFSKLQSLSLLAGGIAHDFNNILTAVLGNISLALLDCQKEDRGRERLVEAEKACGQAQTLARQLLTFAKGGAPIKKLTSVGRLITETGSFTCTGSNVKCEFSLPNNFWAVEADPGQISQVFQNLVINAIQAMPTGGTIRVQGENLEVQTGSELPLDPGRYVRISIQDQGLGIPAEHLPRIFDPYFSTKQTGSGLGLATAYSIVKNHQGHISVKSQLGVGTTFHIYLPAADQQVVEPAGKPREVLTGQGKVLVMDDEEMVRHILDKMLCHLGYQAMFARDGNEAIEMFAAAQKSGKAFDAVILDLTVPGAMGGKSTMEELLKFDPQVKAVVSSGYSEDSIMAEFTKYGFSGVLAKPYRISELSNVLKNLLGKRPSGSGQTYTNI